MYRIALLLVLLVLSACRESDLRLDRTISDHMVLQRGKELSVGGAAIPGSRVVVRFNGETGEARADDSGRWIVKLPAMEAGGPFEMSVESGRESIEVTDVLIGDVWLASGQSNMEWVVANSDGAAEAIRNASDSQIRHFSIPRSWSFVEQDTLSGGSWDVASPETVGSFSAVAYYFALRLRQSTGVPIGILNSTWGGSRIEPWMSASSLGLSGSEVDSMAAADRRQMRAARLKLESLIGEFPTVDRGLVDSVAVWAQAEFDDSAWSDISVPSTWEQQGYERLDGVAWYRTTFELTATEASTGVAIGVGAIDDSDSTFVNGAFVGGMQASAGSVRRYEVAPGVLRVGTNTLAVRVVDLGGNGGIVGDSVALFVESGIHRRPLSNEWKFKVGRASISADAGKNHVPTLLFNAMIRPVHATPVKGVIWYQGESNTGSVRDAVAYSELFQTMILDWRTHWNQPDLPFLWVQLANFMAADAEPKLQSEWATLREAQSDALALPNTGQAVTIDIGDANDVHPRNKQDVGARLALAARRVAYGEDVVHAGPTYVSHEVRGDRVIVSFEHVGTGLVGARDGSVAGFAIAGPDGKFYWADARIGGETIAVSSSHVNNPVAVRYAWGNNPSRANLFNREGLPASPFRTDRPEQRGNPENSRGGSDS